MLEACQCVLADFSNQLKLPCCELCQLLTSRLWEKIVINFSLFATCQNQGNL